MRGTSKKRSEGEIKRKHKEQLEVRSTDKFRQEEELRKKIRK